VRVVELWRCFEVTTHPHMYMCMIHVAKHQTLMIALCPEAKYADPYLRKASCTTSRNYRGEKINFYITKIVTCAASVAQSLGDKTSIVSEKEAGRVFTIYAYAHAQIDFLAIAADMLSIINHLE